MKRNTRAAVGLLALCVLSAPAALAVPLSTLLRPNGGFIDANDKRFDRFEIVFQAQSDGGVVNTDNIEVSALVDGGLDPGPGLTFNVFNDELRVNGDGIYAFIDFSFLFRVSVLDPDKLIKDVSLRIVESGVGVDVDGSNDAGVFILETVARSRAPLAPLAIGDIPIGDLGEISAEFSILDDIGTSVLESTTSFAPQREIWVRKNILVHSVDLMDSASLFQFNQRFSQVATSVPEPSVLPLMTMAVLTVMATGAFARRRRTTD